MRRQAGGGSRACQAGHRKEILGDGLRPGDAVLNSGRGPTRSRVARLRGVAVEAKGGDGAEGCVEEDPCGVVLAQEERVP